MAIRTPLCDLLGIDHPIMLAGMGGVSFAPLCAAVSNAGGFGTLGLAGLGVEDMAAQIRTVKALTDKPFGVDLLAPLPQVLEAATDLMIAEGVAAFISGLGVVPAPVLARLQRAGIKVMNVCGTVDHARKAEAAGLDAVIVQGTEGGGHTGRVAGMALIPQAVDAVSLPVIAAGSIVDGRGLAAALAFGAQSVWMGTRFIASVEAHAGDVFKRAIIETRGHETVVTRCYTGKTMRVRANPYVLDWETRPQDLQPFPQQAHYSAQQGVLGGIVGQIEGLDPARSCLPMGQGAGGIHAIQPCAAIIASVMAEAEAVIDRLAALPRA